MSHYDTFDNEEERLSNLSGFYTTSDNFKLYNINRQKLGNNKMKFEFFNSRGIHLYAKAYFRKKYQKIQIFTTEHELVGTIEKKNKIFFFYPNNEVKPILIIKHINNENGPSSAAVLLTNSHTTQDNINLFIKNKKQNENHFPTGQYVVNQVPILKSWYNYTYSLKFIQRRLISSRKNVRLNIPFQDKTILEFGKKGHNLFHAISRDEFSPVRTAAFCFSWLSVL